ncbi:MAG: VC_2705 family sodium/solute symporter [Rhodoferax sp.]|nr:VC_2705 family sodium/solute symporter [Rhodoferax sp.]
MKVAQTLTSWRLHAVLLALWFAASFGVVFFVRDLQAVVAGWPVGFWFSAQGSVAVFIAIVVFFAWRMNRREDAQSPETSTGLSAYARRIHRRFGIYVAVLLVSLIGLGLAEQAGLPKAWIAGIFLSVTLVLYAGIGVYGRTANAQEYYVAGRRIPAMYNGMATAADWMSAASFISLSGGLYLQGFSGIGNQPGGLAYVLGWTGGFCLVALLVAPYLRQLNLYTLPDYFALRYGGRWPRRIASGAAILCSFTYVVAQIYGVGLITSRLTGLHFEIGILLGLGGVLVCSFLGGMRAVTWTQVAQYVVIILAFTLPVSWLSYQQMGNPFAALAYGQQLPKIAEMEREIQASPAEKQVLEIYAQRAAALEQKLQDVDAAMRLERMELRRQLRELGDTVADDSRAMALRRQIAAVPKDAAAARELWTRQLAESRNRAQPLGGMPPHTQAFAGDPNGSPAEKETFNSSRANFLALMFCLMVGTAGLPHLLTRYFTTPNVAQARESVAWSLFFIALLYLAAPALAVLVKYEVMAHLVGQPMDSLPAWIAQWSRDPSLLSVSDVNGDGILQFSELKVGADVVMLASPEIGGLPAIFSILVAAGGLAAALSTADGLLLTIGNALAHDLVFEGEGDKARSMRPVMWSKFALLVVALLAAYAAAQRPAGILYLVAASFSLAAAGLVPAMVLGIFWSGATRAGAVGGMLTGLGVTLYYMATNLPAFQGLFSAWGGTLWWGIQPVSAGVFGVPAGIAATVLISAVTRAGQRHSSSD